ncbi:MAG: glycosyltransferase family A protein [Mediterraneibacter faecis]
MVPVCNTKAYLGKCIKTIIDQSYKNLEIILIDDGSTGRNICDV